VLEFEVVEDIAIEEMSGVQRHSVEGKRVSVIGAATSGLGAAQLLKTNGAIVFVSDSASEEKLKSQIPNLKSIGVGYEIGTHSDRVYETDWMVISPGVPSNVPVVLEAKRRGIPVISELELASWFCPSPIVAVTGSNGKTTTTTLIGRMVHDAKKKYVVAGNIGPAFSSVVLELDQTSLAVLEVSSFQLDHCETFHPSLSVLLNITPDHLDRYGGSFEQYTAAKCRIFMNQTKDDVLVYCYDDAVTREQVERSARSHVRLLPFGLEQKFEEGAFVHDGKLITMIDGHRSEIIETKEISIKGEHNLLNAMAATLTAQWLKIPVPSIRATLKNFKGVEHRLEFVREVNGVRYFNDSKATNVDSVRYALKAFSEPIILFLGGRDKGNDYSLLHELVKRNVKVIIAIGESAEKVMKAFQSITKVVKGSSMDEAVKTAQTFATKGDVVLLSPACASFDWFEDYKHRGRVFKECVNRLE
jgi:UDP-N-acetylmuramoylalanine--D-glutamate ligase